MNDNIADILSNALQCIEDKQYNDAIAMLQTFVSGHPEMIDRRFSSEVNLLNRLIEYRSALGEWEYFRVMKLVYKYCEKKYASVLPETSPLPSAALSDPDTIWWCWLQGFEQAPELVKACYRSLEKLNRPIQIITNDNYREFVSIPQVLTDKWKSGIISNTHFSDILRIALLTERGGTWIDSTVYCSDNTLITDIMNTSPLFCYSFAMRDTINEEMMYDNWFLHCSSPSPILSDTRTMLYDFWTNEDNTMHYFLFHLLFTLACKRHPAEAVGIPLFSLEPCHILQLELLHPYSELRWKQIMQMSGIHKLTYKYNAGADISGTMLEHFLKTTGN